MLSPQEMEDILDEMYNSFTTMPLQPGDEAYVDCRSVRGDEDVLEDLGRAVRRSHVFTYQLYAGHRGAGKTTELLRLKENLEKDNYNVVYFAADEQDLSSQDVQYTDILLACTRHLWEELESANSEPILKWLQARWQSLQDVMVAEVEVDKLNLEVGLPLFAKLTATMRAQPTQRQQIRERLEAHTETLVKALNEFLEDACNRLPDKRKLLVIADNLDRIAPIFRDNGRSNHEEIFLDRCEQLKAINCHIIYTVPISFIYSGSATELKDNYNLPKVLPSIMVRYENGDPYEPGLEVLRAIVRQRVPQQFRESLVPEIFESEDVLQDLCLASGGYVRDLMQLMQVAINKTGTLPIQRRAVQRAIDDLLDVYRRAMEDRREELRKVHESKNIEHDMVQRHLLFIRCVLEYRYFDERGKKRVWYDVHPVLWEEL